MKRLLTTLVTLCLLAVTKIAAGHALATDTASRDTVASRAATASEEVSGADEPYLKRALPPTPNAAALARYGEYPVSLATGVPEISIPIYTIQCGDFSLPISLSYHASGIRVDEIASTAGLGWTLNAGGAITRSIEGRADLKRSAHSDNIAEEDTLFMNPATVKRLIDDIKYKGRDPRIELKDLLEGGMEALYDTSSDRYSFNFGNRSGVMRYSYKDNEFVPLNHFPGKIEHNLYNGLEFTVLDADGTTYEFKQPERNGIIDSDGVTEVTSWYMTRVITLGGDTIDFDYERARSFYTYSLSWHALATTVYKSDPSNDRYWFEKEFHLSQQKVTTYDNFPIVVKRIRWRGQRVEMDYADDRRDPATSRLKRVSVINGYGDTLVTVRLEHEWFGRDNADYRMMLKKVGVSGRGTYTMRYDESHWLPCYPGFVHKYGTTRPTGSATLAEGGTDYWGYYNGHRISNLSTEAVVKAKRHAGLPHPEAVSYGDLSAVLDSARLGSLTEIQYPSGGKTWLQYELNTSGGGLRIASISDTPGHQGKTVTRRFEYYHGLKCLDIDERFITRGVHYALDTRFPGAYHPFDECSVYSGPVCPLTPESGVSVFYPYVRETRSDGSHTEYDYTLGMCKESHGIEDWEHPSLAECVVYDEGSLMPMLSQKREYSADNKLLRTTDTEYAPSPTKKFTAGTKVASLLTIDDPDNGGISTTPWKEEIDMVKYRPLTAQARVALPVRTVTEDFTTGARDTAEYTYADLTKTLQPRSVTRCNGDGEPLVRTSGFVYERADAVSREMAADFLTTDLVTDTKITRGGEETSASSVEYAKVGGGYYVPCAVKAAVGGAPLRDKERLLDFDSRRNPHTVVENGSDTTRLEWDRLGLYPISSEAGGLTIRYEWKPLFGVTKITDPAGRSATYTYGPEGRLERSADSRGPVAAYAYTPTRVTTKTHVSTAKTRDSYTDHDGLGRPIGTVSPGPGGGLIKTWMSYDALGRESRKWRPVADGVGIMSDMALQTYGDADAYSDISYDGLGRVTFTSTPGTAWVQAGKGVSRAYGSNSAKDVKRYGAPTSKVSMTKDGHWPAHTLSSTLVTDEDGLTVETFTDKEGRAVLERRGGKSDTYRVYNRLGQLRYVLSPQYQESGYKAVYGYEYRYDSLGRVAKRILPGCEYETYAYHGRTDRVAYYTDAALRAKGLVRYYVYDRARRLTEQGVCRSADGSYSGRSFETIIHHDGYGFIAACDSADLSLLRKANPARAEGLVTGRELRLSDGTVAREAVYYDNLGRAAETRTLYPGGRLVTETTEYSYDDKPVKVTVTDSSTGVRTVREIEYDAASGLPLRSGVGVSKGRAPQVAHTSATTYDGIGRAVSTDRGGAGVTGWAYDVSGRTAAISGPGFSASLHYADGLGTPRYNGFLSSMTWRGPGDSADRGYKYGYDSFGRLIDAVYGEGPALDKHRNRYNETVLEYSANSMPKRLQRRGLKQDGEYGKVDNLHIRLDGNRVASVTDDALPVIRPGATDFNDADSGNTYEYDYDACGRLTRDDNRGVASIEYDDLGNPRLVSFADGSSTSYVYAPEGRKLRVIHRTAITPAGTPGSPSGVFVSDTTDYAGPVVTRNGSVERVLIDGGHATLDASGSATYHFHTLDHLGNVRAVVNDRGLVEQHTHYYPYGGIFADASSGQDLQPLRYNGKELDRVHGLDTYDYGFRQYYPMVPMWDRMDQLSESYTHISPYAYCLGNPTILRDEQGLYAEKEEAIDDYKRKGFDESLMDKNIHKNENGNGNTKWFIAMNEDSTDAYKSGGTMTRYFGETTSSDSMVLSALSTDPAIKNDVFSVVNNDGIGYKGGDAVDKYIRGTKFLGYGLAAASAVVTINSVMKDYNNGNYTTAFAKGVVGATIIGIGFMPGGGIVSVGLGIMEAKYGERVYNYVRKHYDGR